MKTKNLKIFGAVTAIVGVPVVLTTIVFTTRKAKCDIEVDHAHKYVNSNKIVRYIDSEWYNVQGYDRQADYVEISNDNKQLMKFEKKHKLAKIKDNEELIQNIMNSNDAKVEFRYKYYHRRKIGKNYHTVEKYHWAEVPPVDTATGEERIILHKYQGYKIETDVKGNYVLIPSGYVENLLDIKEEYPYMRDDFDKKIDSRTGDIASYEDKEPTKSDIKLTNKKVESEKKLTK